MRLTSKSAPALKVTIFTTLNQKSTLNVFTICNQRIDIQVNAIVVKTKERPPNSTEPDSDVTNVV